MEAGLLTPADWRACWIHPHEDEVAAPGRRPAYLLRDEVVLASRVVSARAYVTAHGICELWLNGMRVGDAELTPGFTDYRTRVQVQTFDVSDLLRAGRNAVAAELSDGWFRGINGMFRDSDCFGDRTSLLLQIHAVLEDGTEQQWATHADWRSTSGGLTAADLMMGVEADLGREPTGWREPGFDDQGRDSVELDDTTGFGTLAASAAPPVRRTELRRPLSVRRAPSGDQVVDVGENVVGWVRFDALGALGTRMRLTYAEALSPPGEASQRNLLPDPLPPDGLEVTAGQLDVVVAAGRPGESFEPRDSTTGFRYVGVAEADRHLTVDDVTCMRSDLRRIGGTTRARCSSRPRGRSR